MKKILLLTIILIGLSACSGDSTKYPTVIRTGMWEVCQVNDSTLMAVPTNGNGDNNKPILFKLSDTETLNGLSEE